MPSGRARSTRCAPPRPSRRCRAPSAASGCSPSPPPSATPVRARRREHAPPRPRSAAAPTLAALALLLAALLPGARAAAQGAPAKNCPAVDLRYDDAENIAEKRTDKNHDCKPDEIVYYADGK